MEFNNQDIEIAGQVYLDAIPSTSGMIMQFNRDTSVAVVRILFASSDKFLIQIQTI